MILVAGFVLGLLAAGGVLYLGLVALTVYVTYELERPETALSLSVLAVHARLTEAHREAHDQMRDAAERLRDIAD